MKKEQIPTEEERCLTKLKYIYKQQKKMDKILNISRIQRKKNQTILFPTISNQLIQYKQPVYHYSLSQI